MNKKIVAVLIALNMSVLLYAANESDDSKKPDSSLGWNIRMGYSFPIINLDFGSEPSEDHSDEYNFAATGGAALLSIAFSSVTLSGGVQYTVIPHILAPGIYADLHFNLLSWGFTFMFTNNNFILFQGGIRMYNQFQLGNISLEPFLGVNFVYIGINDQGVQIPFMTAGFIFNIGIFGFEYGYNFIPARDGDGEIIPLLGIHRFTLLWKLNPYR